MTKYFVQGRGEVSLSQADFKAQGGEGAIYVKGSTAYKIYFDRARVINPAKIQELSALSLPNIIRPLDLLLDAHSRPVGYSMRHVGQAYALCQLFPKAFRSRKRLTPDAALRLVRALQEGVRHAHSKGILIVDLNEMNFLVSEDFREVFFIDVDSYQTPSFPATVLMESVRDRHSKTFSEGTDWFSFAVVSFQMFVGIHPFKGTYATLQSTTGPDEMLDARMRANVSVLHAGVRVPAACLPFSVIPPAYLDWYKAVFEEGKRLPPPEQLQHVLIQTPARAEESDGSGQFELTELQEFDGEVIAHDGVVTVTRDSIYFGGRKHTKPCADAEVAVTPRLRHLVAVFIDGTQVRFQDLTAGREIQADLRGEEIMSSDGRVYVRRQGVIVEVGFVEMPQSILVGAQVVGNVLPRATRLYEGVALQNIVGTFYASFFPAPGVCRQVRLDELNGYQIVEARLMKNVLAVVGAKGGRYDRLVFRFAEDFGGYDTRLTPGVSPSGLNFAVLDTGVCLLLNDNDELEIFPRRRGSDGFRLLSDPSVRGDDRLLCVGRRALLARGKKLYGFRMKSEQG